MKSKTLKISLIILLLAVITMSIISGTLAKYVETVTGTDAARVAKFEYTATAGGTELTSDSVATINLFNTVNDVEVYEPSQSGSNKNGNDKLVAPGTFGHFNVVVTNKSEVKVAVTYDITETQANIPTGASNIPIVYFVKPQDGDLAFYSNAVSAGLTVAVGSDVATYINTLTSETIAANSQVTVSGNLNAMASALGTEIDATNNNSTGTTKTDVVGWFWAFGDNTNNVDTNDTKLGLDGTATVTTNVGVKFTQVD